MKKLNFFETVLLKIFGNLFKDIMKEETNLAIETSKKATEDAIKALEIENLNKKVSSLVKLITPERAKKINDPSLHEFPEKGLAIRTEKGRERDSLKFHVSLPCWKEGEPDFYVSFPFKGYVYKTNWDMSGHSSPSSYNTSDDIKKFVNALFALNCIANIDTDDAFTFELKKSGATTWEAILPKVIEAIASHFPKVEVPA